uniref:Uncharacterized protein n=1 Tax=Oncorhynchus tshawytscha TaxID=74940 RepID=A0A8C8M4A7_ONCTS
MDAKCLSWWFPMFAMYVTQGSPSTRAILNWLKRDQFANLKTSETETGRDVVRQRDNQESTERVTEDQQNHLGFPNVGPAGVCCRFGCNMSELLQYC